MTEMGKSFAADFSRTPHAKKSSTSQNSPGGFPAAVSFD
jgi:hypothetical protein